MEELLNWLGYFIEKYLVYSYNKNFFYNFMKCTNQFSDKIGFQKTDVQMCTHKVVKL